MLDRDVLVFSIRLRGFRSKVIELDRCFCILDRLEDAYDLILWRVVGHLYSFFAINLFAFLRISLRI